MTDCFNCDRPAAITAHCCGSNCEARICADCFTDPGLCVECEQEQHTPYAELHISILVTGLRMEGR